MPESFGGFDSHVHAAPDVVERLDDDIAIGDSYARAGFSGFVLKAHYESTVGRAHCVARLTGLNVYGGIALNQHTDGINPSAVAAALSAGGRVVWMPTADAHTQRTAGLPRLCTHEHRVPEHTYAIPPVAPDAESAVDGVLALIADHDAVLATGHVGAQECRWVVERAASFGIDRILLTHPSYTVPGMSPDAIRALVDAGAWAEITAFQLLHQPGCTPAMLARVAEAAGPRLVLSSDAGQPDSPPPPEALALLVDALESEGLDRGWLEASASSTPAALFSPR